MNIDVPDPVGNDTIADISALPNPVNTHELEPTQVPDKRSERLNKDTTLPTMEKVEKMA